MEQCDHGADKDAVFVKELTTRGRFEVYVCQCGALVNAYADDPTKPLTSEELSEAVMLVVERHKLEAFKIIRQHIDQAQQLANQIA